MIDLTILALGVLLSASIGLFVYARNPKNIVNRLYVILTLSFIFYPIANYLSLQTDDRLIYIRAVIFFSTLAVGSLYYLVFLLNNQDAKLSRIQHLGIYYTVFVAIISWTPLVFKGLTEGANPTPVPNFLAPLFLVHLVTFPAASFILMAKRMRSVKGAQRLQYIYMMIGIAPIFLLAPVTAFVMPIVFQNASLIGLSPIYALFFVGGIGLAIVRYRLFDIRFFAIRAAAYLTTLFVISVAVVLPVLLVLESFLDLTLSGTQTMLGVLGGVSLLYLFLYVRRSIDRLTSRVFFRHYYDAQDVLGRLGDILVRTAEIDVLSRDTASTLQEALKSTLLKYVLFKGEKSDALLAKHINAIIGNANPEVIDVDAPQGIDGHLLELLKNENIALIIRLRTKQEDLGYMVLGYKQSGEGYTERDKHFLLVAAGEISIGLQNALRFQEIEQFNATLQQKVDEATKKVRKTNQRLRLLDQTKDDFISMASHQLRTPLTSVKGYVSMVLDGDGGAINGTQRKLLNQSFISAQRMTYLISDLLNVSRLRTGKFIIETMPTDLAKVVGEELDQLQETVKSRGLELEYHHPEHFPVLMLDETKLRQVIMNFVDNAIYYTPSGGRIDVYLAEKPQSIEFTVVDTGIGVPKHEQHHLFTKFYRAKNAKSARPDGTGLGIFMAKKVIIAQGGAVIFKSTEGKGSTFGFTFPKATLLPKTDTRPH